MVVKVSGRVSVKLEEDITFTFRKWNSEDLDNHSDCSLQVKFSRNRGEYLCLDKTWKHFGECNYFGAGNLVNGQKWPGRIHMSGMVPMVLLWLGAMVHRSQMEHKPS